MTKKIIALDLDGTLLRSDSTLSDYTKKTLTAVKNQGHKIIIATGRPYRMAYDFYKELDLDTPMITFNGALTLMPGQNWEHEHSRSIDRRFLFDLLGKVDDFQLDFVASEYKHKFFVTLDKAERIDPKLFGVEKLTEEVRLFPDKITDDPNALFIQTRHEDRYQLADEIRDYFQHQLEVDSWGGPYNILEFAPKGVHKAYALTYVLKLMGESPDKLIAFGDEHNDTEMLALAKYGYAMKNANPKLADYTDLQLEATNDEDGVAKQLEKLFL